MLFNYFNVAVFVLKLQTYFSHHRTRTTTSAKNKQTITSVVQIAGGNVYLPQSPRYRSQYAKRPHTDGMQSHFHPHPGRMYRSQQQQRQQQQRLFTGAHQRGGAQCRGVHPSARRCLVEYDETELSSRATPITVLPHSYIDVASSRWHGVGCHHEQ